MSELMRINKFLSSAGVCSRRQADSYIEYKRIKINNEYAVLGDMIGPEDVVMVDDVVISTTDTPKPVLLAFYKPEGIVCTTEKRERDNVVEYINYPVRIYPIGRLDKESEGLLLLTNDGSIVNHILRARYYHEKEYLVKVDQTITADFLKQMREGVAILDTVTRPCKVVKKSNNTFSIVLTQGLNRQIRRMCDALGYRVRFLKRTRVMNITLGELQPGEYREIEGKEYEELISLFQKQ